MTVKTKDEKSLDILVEDIFGKMVEEKNYKQKTEILDDIGLQVNHIRKEISKNSRKLSGEIYSLEDFIKNDVELEDVVKRIKIIDNKSQDLLKAIDEYSVDSKNNFSELKSSLEDSNRKNNTNIFETLKKNNQELIKNDELLTSLLQSSDLNHKNLAKDIMHAISDVSQLLNNNNYNISKLLEEITTIYKLVCSKYDSLLQQIDESSQNMDEEFTLTKEAMDSQYKELNSCLKSIIDNALIESNNNYEIAQRKLDKISLSNKFLVALNFLILIVVIFASYNH